AASAGKKVYACTDANAPFAETITLANGVNIYGFFTCAGGTWTQVASKHAVVVPPARTINGSVTVALQATNVSSATRVDSVDFIAPDLTAASASSVGAFFVNSPAITIANSKIHAGAGGNGANGASGLTPVQVSTTLNGNGTTAGTSYCTNGAGGP